MKVAIDVGSTNMALCALRFSTAQKKKKTCSLDYARDELHRSELICWEVVALAGSKTFGEKSTSIANFVKERQSIFEAADIIIIEHQMQAPMRCIAAALFASIRMISEASFIFQQSKMKLQWEGVQAPSTYNARKKMAIQLTSSLLTPEMASIFEISKKKDDLADSLLHLLKFECRHMNKV